MIGGAKMEGDSFSPCCSSSSSSTSGQRRRPDFFLNIFKVFFNCFVQKFSSLRYAMYLPLYPSNRRVTPVIP
jgi:hypothetical protein